MKRSAKKKPAPVEVTEEDLEGVYGSALRIEGNYELTGEKDVLLKIARAREPSESVLIMPDSMSDKRVWRVMDVGSEVTKFKPGDLVQASGRVDKVVNQNLLAEYVTMFPINGRVHIIVPEHEIKAKVS